MKPLIMIPSPDYTIWGNDNVSRFRGADRPYGTWWEVSAHPYRNSALKNLPGKNLQEVIDEDKEGILGPGLGMHEMLRLAMLDARDDLSIQVHPDDAHAPADDYGKAESWYIISAVPGATLVAGTDIDDAAAVRKALEDGTLDEHLVRHEMHAGDFIYIPSGLLHALGAGIQAIEIGTNSNTTFRFYDYNRRDKDGNLRKLNIEESFDSADFSLKPTIVRASDSTHSLLDAAQFSVAEKYISGPETILCGDTYFILSNMGDDTIIRWNGEEIPFGKWESALIPWNAGKITLENAHVLESRPKK